MAGACTDTTVVGPGPAKRVVAGRSNAPATHVSVFLEHLLDRHRILRPGQRELQQHA
jgi:hypothetical protein